MSFFHLLMQGAHPTRKNLDDLRRSQARMRRSQDRLRRSLRQAQSERDTDQDARIAQLEEDNLQLQLCLNALLRLLTEKDVLTSDEWLLIAETLQDEGEADVLERVDE